MTRELDPAIQAATQGALPVSTGSGLDMDVQPTEARGRAATFRLTFHNHAPAPVSVVVMAHDSAGELRFRFQHSEPVIVPTGSVISVMVHVVPKVCETVGVPHAYGIVFQALRFWPVPGSNVVLMRQARFTYVPPITTPVLAVLPAWVRRLPLRAWALSLVLLFLVLVLTIGRPVARPLMRMAVTLVPAPPQAQPTVQPTRHRALLVRHKRALPPPDVQHFTLIHQQGQPYELVWQTRDAQHVTLDGQPVSAHGAMVLQPPLHSALYRLVATNGSRRAVADLHVVVDALTADPHAFVLTTPDIATFALRRRHGQLYAVWQVRHAVSVQLQGQSVASAGERLVPPMPRASMLRLVASNDVGSRQMLLYPTFPGGSQAIRAENALPGTSAWVLTHPSVPAHLIEGYANLTSVNVGGQIGFYVNVSPATSYAMDIFRMGWYQGTGARFMGHVPNLAGTTQPACPTQATLRTVYCTWARSYTLHVPTTWTSGVYLCRLTRADGFQSYIIFVVRNDASHSTYLFQSGVTTYEAYNLWGGRSLYAGSAGAGISTTAVGSEGTAKTYAQRSYAVSFDRPYAEANGAGNFFYFEYPMLRWLERNGYDVTYSTDLDTDASARLLLQHKAFLSVGHDEYWSEDMRDNVEAARGHGVSLGFFGADASAWKVRFEPSSLGPRRVMVCYKDPAIDPEYRAHRPDLATVEWRDPLIGRPEQLLLGAMYESLLAGGAPDFPLRPIHTTAWPYAGTGLHDGALLPRIVGYEYDRVFPSVPTPPGLQILAASPVVDAYGHHSTANVTLYTAPSGARVFDAGAIHWDYGLDDGPLDAGYPQGSGHHVANAAVQRITANILDNFAR